MDHILEITAQFFTHACVALLSGYLSLSASLATGIQHILVKSELLAPSSIAKIDTLTPLPSRYSDQTPIPRILIDNAAYQEAAALGSTASSVSFSPASVADALVNIFCTYTEGKEFHATTGSGVFIDSKGIILTNAHVAQFLLLKQTRKNTRCVIRQGNPAQEKYIADLLYISPAWIHENANLIDAEAPSGTGERDYALLYIKNAIQGPLPSVFPALSFSTTYLKRNELKKFLVAGYPAKIFSEEGPRAELIPRVASTTLSDMFTFGSGKADVIAVHDSVVGEQGSSGGPLLTEDGTVLGLIVTKGSQKDGAHSLRAITLPYINQAILSETGFDLRSTLEGNIVRRSEIFKEALVPFLSSLLETEFH